MRFVRNFVYLTPIPTMLHVSIYRRLEIQKQKNQTPQKMLVNRDSVFAFGFRSAANQTLNDANSRNAHENSDRCDSAQFGSIRIVTQVGVTETYFALNTRIVVVFASVAFL